MFKKIALCSLIAAGCSMTAFADDVGGGSGFYIGGQAGVVNTGYNTDSTWVKPSFHFSVDNNKFAGGVYAGYMFSDYLGLQAGYTYYGKPEFTEKSTGLTNSFVQQGLDVSAVAKLHFIYNLGFYLKGGATWIFRGTLADNNYFVGKKSAAKCAPLAGIGLTYAFTNKWSSDLGWTRVFSSGDLPRMDFYALGLTYKF